MPHDGLPSPTFSKAPVYVEPLAQHLSVGRLPLGHRFVLAPLTRFRANKDHVHGDLAVQYYSQRASTPGTLLITEGTFITDRAGGFDNVPGIWNAEQVSGWKKVTSAVHAKGSFIFCQLWALGRAAARPMLPSQYDVVSSGDIALPDATKPRPLSEQEIDEYVKDYVHAAHNAIEAGFDGVEIHSANGYLLDQFLQTNSNNRNDAYGGSAENRIRFTSRVVQAVSDAVGAHRTAVRLSPYERYNGMGMSGKDIFETFGLIIRTLAPLDLAYLHLTEPRVSGQLQARVDSGLGVDESLEWAAALWFGRPDAEEDLQAELGVHHLPPVEGTGSPTNVLILAGGYTALTAAIRVADATARGERVAIAFGRWFISNPDLPKRILHNLPLTSYNRPTFYLREQAEGYIDYPFAKPEKEEIAPQPRM